MRIQISCPCSFLLRLSVLCVVFVGGLDNANAQLFGDRSGNRLGSQQARTRPGSAAAAAPEEVGQVTGAERFLRGNRDRASFVGADRTETQNFVGSEQATMAGTIVSSTAGITPPADSSRSINRPLKTPTTTQMYLPRISLRSLPPLQPRNQSSQSATTRSISDPVAVRVAHAVKLASRSPIEVSVQGRTAILRGAVASEAEKRLTETLVLFEPGISEVTNQLTVANQLTVPNQLAVPNQLTVPVPQQIQRSF